MVRYKRQKKGTKVKQAASADTSILAPLSQETWSVKDEARSRWIVGLIAAFAVIVAALIGAIGGALKPSTQSPSLTISMNQAVQQFGIVPSISTPVPNPSTDAYGDRYYGDSSFVPLPKGSVVFNFDQIPSSHGDAKEGAVVDGNWGNSFSGSIHDMSPPKTGVRERVPQSLLNTPSTYPMEKNYPTHSAGFGYDFVAYDLSQKGSYDDLNNTKFSDAATF